MEIILKKVEIKNQTIKCNCTICKGTGIGEVKNNVGIICDVCQGKGYYLRALPQNQQVFCDINTKIFYLVEDKKIIGPIDFFIAREIIDNVPKVVLKNNYNNKLSNMLNYVLFLQDNLPYLTEEYGCPSEFLNNYNGKKLSSECQECHGFIGCCNCEKYSDREDCWNKFYSESKEAEKVYKLKK